MKRASLLITTLFASAALRAQPAAPGGGALSLSEAIREALANNLDLAADKLNLPVAQAREITAALRPNPVLTISGQTLDLLGARFNPSSPAGPNQFNAHTDYVIERGRKREERIRVAAADRELAEMEIREAVRRLVLDVQAAFVDVQLAAANLTLAEDNLKSLRGIVIINEARVQSGDLAVVELERSRVAAMQYEVAVETARLEQQQAKSRLARLLGRRDLSIAFDVGTDFRQETLAQSQGALLKLALDRRPDLLSARQTQARSGADLRLQLANGKIDYVLGSEYTYQRAYGFGGSSLGFSISMPLPVYNRNQGEIARAEREAKRSEARIRAIEAAIASEMEIAWRQYETSRRLLESIETTMLSKSRTVREVTEYSYRRGEASLVEFLDAQRAFNDTMQSYNGARASFARSLYLIDAVSGLTAAPGAAAASTTGGN